MRENCGGDDPAAVIVPPPPAIVYASRMNVRRRPYKPFVRLSRPYWTCILPGVKRSFASSVPAEAAASGDILSPKPLLLSSADPAYCRSFCAAGTLPP